jgi:hypothetical protein
MAFIRRTWTPKDADEWSKEDVYACILAPITYITIMIGTAMSLLGLVSGYVMLALAVAAILALLYIIDPKLRMISNEYEKKQKEYLQKLEENQRWEEKS